MSKIALLFDVDGTLWDTTNSTYKAENIITKKYNLPEVTKEKIRQCFGYNRVESAKVYFPTLDLDTAIEYKIEADKEKIRISNAILVVNVDNYIGESTKSEIDFAKSLNKEIIYYTDMK